MDGRETTVTGILVWCHCNVMLLKQTNGMAHIVVIWQLQQENTERTVSLQQHDLNLQPTSRNAKVQLIASHKPSKEFNKCSANLEENAYYVVCTCVYDVGLFFVVCLCILFVVCVCVSLDQTSIPSPYS
jgi:hypothetical protein